MLSLCFFISGGLLLCLLFYKWWLKPLLLFQRLRRNGFVGPPPSFPIGNLSDINVARAARPPLPNITHNIHSFVFPHFAHWRKIYGNIFVYWLGTEPFLYVADPEFLRRATYGALSKKWGKPNVFQNDRKPLFGSSLVMAEGDNWSRHRHIISPAFSTTNLSSMISAMEQSTERMLERWVKQVTSGDREVDAEKDNVKNAFEIIARTSFGIDEEKGKKVFEKLQAMQNLIFRGNLLVGVPFSSMLHPVRTYTMQKLGREVDVLLIDMANSRKDGRRHSNDGKNDLLGILVDGYGQERGNNGGKCLTTRQLVDECKALFFGGHETTSLAITWTLFLLALYPEWQTALREEVVAVVDQTTTSLSYIMLNKLTKMGWVWNEMLRLYSPAANAHRQARDDIVVPIDDKAQTTVVIPRGTNMWVDIMAIHHDPSIWGDDVDEFRPERFEEGRDRRRQGFVPFGIGERVCVGRYYSEVEYRVVMTMILRRFTWSLSPSYCHSPEVMLTLRPAKGLQLLLKTIS